jgi:hypothetical protein
MKTLFAVASLCFGFVTFVPYFVEMWKGTAKPHIFSWVTWSLLTGLGFILSLRGGGGEGAWIFGLQSLLCLLVAVYAIFKGEKHITRTDWISFAGALTVTVVYLFTKNGPVSAFLAATIDSLGFVPTFRKSYLKPLEEPALTYFFSFLGFLFSLGALQVYSFETVFYPLALVVANCAFVIFLLVRRKSLVDGTAKT